MAFTPGTSCWAVAALIRSAELGPLPAAESHTVNDHIKTILSKCGVTSRGELVARSFADHILEHHHAATARL